MKPRAWTALPLVTRATARTAEVARCWPNQFQAPYNEGRLELSSVAGVDSVAKMVVINLPWPWTVG